MSHYVSRSPVFKQNGHLFAVNGSESKPYYTDIMKVIIDQMDAYLSYHSRVFIVVMVLTTRVWTRDNVLISECLAVSLQRLKSEYKLSRIGYVWCREQSRSSTQHYHLALMLDGSKVQYPAKLFDLISEVWHALCQGRVCWPKRCYYAFHRSDRETLCQVIYRLSYFAKVRTKDRTPKWISRFGASRLKLHCVSSCG
ncbi:inovirus Gp2 family protein [Vibrio fluvialis]|nr:inovirus Gp2 family protein [Vibrio fluvialis]